VKSTIKNTAQPQPLERREFSPDAPPQHVFAWTSQAGAKDGKPGLRYTWVLPKDYDKQKSYKLVVICHGTGLDYRWGHWNYPAGEFRPGDIVISVDGPSPDPGPLPPGATEDDRPRLFLGEPGDALVFRDFLLEISRTFPVDRIYLYGHSQGSFFVTYFAGLYPGVIDGIVAHASGVWTWTNIKGGVTQTPLALMHGTMDPVVPYGQSVGAFDAYVQEGHKSVLLRRMPGYNHWPNAVRASECIDWCVGMSSTDPAEVLAAAEAMLKAKPVDGYGYTCPVPYGGARRILSRIVGEADDAPKGVTPGQKASAAALIARIEQEGKRHVDALRADVKSRDDLLLGAGALRGAWLGRLAPVREDFRGVESVESYVKEIGYDEAVKAHEQAAGAMYLAWYGDGSEKQKFEAVVDALPRCFLCRALPIDLIDRMKDMKRRTAELQLTEESLEKFENVLIYETALRVGADAYRAVWQRWK
jgi:predicted esterase